MNPQKEEAIKRMGLLHFPAKTKKAFVRDNLVYATVFTDIVVRNERSYPILDEEMLAIVKMLESTVTVSTGHNTEHRPLNEKELAFVRKFEELTGSLVYYVTVYEEFEEFVPAEENTRILRLLFVSNDCSKWEDEKKSLRYRKVRKIIENCYVQDVGYEDSSYDLNLFRGRFKRYLYRITDEGYLRTGVTPKMHYWGFDED